MATKFTYTAESKSVIIAQTVKIPVPIRRVNEDFIRRLEYRIVRFLRTRFPAFVRVFVIHFEPC